MKLDATLPMDLRQTGQVARSLEEAGYDGLWMGEVRHDPFLQCLEAAQATEHVVVGTSIAIAFARSPMTLASTGYDLARYSGGRFVLGLGSQVKPHIERRFSMPWSHPAARMREFVLALKAIWACWLEGTPLDFRGEFYTHTLMTPFFAPQPQPEGAPPVYLAGVGDLMTEVAGEVADGFFVHPFTTRRYLEEVTLPALRRGSARSSRSLREITVCGPSFVTVGRTEEEIAVAAAATKGQIAFYASTPAYRPVLDLHGWGDIQPELTRLSKQNRWTEMGGLVTDEMLQAFSVVGPPSAVGPALRAKLDGIYDRTTLYVTYDVHRETTEEIVTALRG